MGSVGLLDGSLFTVSFLYTYTHTHTHTHIHTHTQTHIHAAKVKDAFKQLKTILENNIIIVSVIPFGIYFGILSIST